MYLHTVLIISQSMRIKIKHNIDQRLTILALQIAMASKFFHHTPNILGPSDLVLFLVTFLRPRIFRNFFQGFEKFLPP